MAGGIDAGQQHAGADHEIIMTLDISSKVMKVIHETI
jgi:hypothetical protein